MDLTLILFIILAVTAIATALGLLISRNAVYAALFLVMNFACVAIFYLLLGAPFIAMAQVTVYAGAIMVLFLFVIMLLGAEKLPKGDVLPVQRPLAIGAAVILLAEAVILLVQRFQSTAMLQAPGTVENSMDSLREMSGLLFTEYLLPFEVTSILLLVAMVGAIVLTKQEKGTRG
ncbi:MAG: NADH-quinone oxidoreductase subunit J [Anaerolineaceae bacterium]|nr:MAG: NADH-quinone oxidoreductase subunit J [Anaerolineaceae bacterium]